MNEELREPPSRIVLDLAGLTFCDSLGLGTLVVLSRTARVQQTYLLLRNPSPFFTRMLDVTGVGESHVLGVEAPIWTETIKTPADLQNGDRLRTGAGSKCEIAFEDGSRVELGAKADFTPRSNSVSTTDLPSCLAMSASVLLR